jgi:hypothetical protein
MMSRRIGQNKSSKSGNIWISSRCEAILGKIIIFKDSSLGAHQPSAGAGL